MSSSSKEKNKIIHTIIDKTLITKGWSGDKKYRITDEQGKPFLQRISPVEQYERKKRQFAQMQQAREILEWYEDMTCVVPKWYRNRSM